METETLERADSSIRFISFFATDTDAWTHIKEHDQELIYKRELNIA